MFSFFTYLLFIFIYRVIVKQVFPESMILAYNCDYGDIIWINVDNLKPLTRELRAMPQAAMAAKLYGNE